MASSSLSKADLALACLGLIIPVFVCVSLLDQPRGLSTLPVPLQTYLFSSVERDSIKDCAEQETKERSIPATQLVLPAGPGLGSFGLPSRRGLPGNSPEARVPSAVPSWVTQAQEM